MKLSFFSSLGYWWCSSNATDCIVKFANFCILSTRINHRNDCKPHRKGLSQLHRRYCSLKRLFSEIRTSILRSNFASKDMIILWEKYSIRLFDAHMLENFGSLSHKPTFEWPFLRSLSKGIKAKITPKDAQFCQVHFSYRTFLVRGLNLYLYAVF